MVNRNLSLVILLLVLCPWLAARTDAQSPPLAPPPSGGQQEQPSAVMVPRGDNTPKANPIPVRTPVHFHVTAANEKLSMVVNTSRIVTLDRKVARLLVNNPQLLRATPLSPNQIQVAALTSGVTTLNMWDENDQVYSIDVLVSGDSRQLDEILRREFPQAMLRVTPLNNDVLITGFVPQPDMVHTIERIAQNFYQGVINRIEVGGVQQILLHTKVIEVSRSKARTLGIDWANINGDDSIIQGISGLVTGSPVGPTVATAGAPTLQFGIITGANSFFGFIEAMQQKGIAKILAEPSLVTVSGRAARFNNGGEFPIVVPQGQGSVSVEFREYGTIVDFVPVVLGNGRIHLEVRPTVSALDPANGVSFGGITVPGLRSRGVDTAVEMEAGQTFALAGLIQNQVESTETSVPWLGDLPWIGAAFRRKTDSVNEVELIILVTPEFVSPMNPHEVPPCGPGQETQLPSNPDFYLRGYMEVPRCNGCGQCSQCQYMSAPHGVPSHVPVQQQQAPIYPVVPDSVQSRSFQQNPNSSSYRKIRVASQRNLPANSAKPKPSIVGPIGYDVIK